MMQIHPQARTTPAARAEIARSPEPTSVVAKRYGISDETVRKWRKRGEQTCQDRSSRPKRLPWRVTEEERAIICAVRRATGFPLDDLTFVLRHFLPHLNRDNIYRVLRAEGLNRRPAKLSTLPAKGQGRFGPVSARHVGADNGAYVEIIATVEIAGGAQQHFFSNQNGHILMTGSTVTLTGTPAFSNAFAVAQYTGLVSAYGNSYSGAATGMRYRASGNGVIFVNAGGEAVFPGDTAGLLMSGGQYA